MLDPTQVLLAVIAIITTLLGGIGAALFFLGRYFISQIESLQKLWREDQKAWLDSLTALSVPIHDLIENNKHHEKNTQDTLQSIETTTRKIYNQRRRQQ